MLVLAGGAVILGQRLVDPLVTQQLSAVNFNNVELGAVVMFSVAALALPHKVR
jgi:hypothetical protein